MQQTFKAKLFCCLPLTVFFFWANLEGYKALKERCLALALLLSFWKANCTDCIEQDIRIAMALSSKYCIRDSTTDLYTDKHGDIQTKGVIIFCKKHPFIITENGYINQYIYGAMDNIFQGLDSEFEVLQDKVKKNKNQNEIEAFLIGCFFC